MNKNFFVLTFITFITIMTSYGQLETSMDSLMQAYSGTNPGASLLIVENGRKVFQKAYGMANLENKIPAAIHTNFRLASITKQFTATGIMLLAERGMLDLDQTLDKIFGEFPAYGKFITIKNLLNHTSGIPDYEDYVPEHAIHPQVKDEGVLKIILKTDTPYFEPGTEFRYSNTAYALLALIVEKISGKRFGIFLEEEIFSPLKMKRTIAFEKGINDVSNRAFGFNMEKGRWALKDQSSTSAVLGDGGIYSNTEDLYMWDQSLYKNQLLSATLLKEMFTYGKLNNGNTFPYGLGWHLKNWKENEIVYHTGSSTSFRNIFYRIPQKRFSIILLTNRNEPEESDMVEIAEKIAAIYFNIQAD